MPRRLLLLIASVAVALGSVGATAAQAEAPAPTDPPTATPTATETAGGYWTCIAIAGVGGTCVSNPLP